MQPFYIIFNRPTKDYPKPALMAHDALAVRVKGNVRKPTAEEIAAVTAQYPELDTHPIFGADYFGVWEKRAEVRAAIKSVEAHHLPVLNPVVRCIGGKIKRSVRRVDYFKVEQRNRKTDKEPGEPFYDWFGCVTRKTRAEARNYVASRPDKAEGWEYKISPVYKESTPDAA